MRFQRHFSNEGEVDSYAARAPVGLPGLSLVVRDSLAQGLMRVSWTTMHHWLSNTNSEKKWIKLSFTMRGTSTVSCKNKKYFQQNNLTLLLVLKDSSILILLYLTSLWSRIKGLWHEAIQWFHGTLWTRESRQSWRQHMSHTGLPISMRS